MTNDDVKSKTKQMWASGDCFVTSHHWQWASEFLCDFIYMSNPIDMQSLR